MPQATISLQLVEPYNVIRKKIYVALADELNKIFQKSSPKILSKLQANSPNYFKNTETYNAIAGGELEAHFGFWKGSGVVKANSIVDAISSGINVVLHRVRVVGGTLIVGGLSINFVKDDFSDILSLDVANIMWEKEGELIPWLKWLLFRGETILVSEYNIQFVSGKGRSRQAIMISEKSGSWNIPNRYAGTSDDNWITKVLISANYKKMIKSTVETILIKATT